MHPHQQKQQPEHIRLDAQLVPGCPFPAQVLRVRQRRYDSGVLCLTGGEPCGERQPPRRQRNQILLGADVRGARAQKIHVEDDVLILHPLPVHAPQGVERPRRDYKEVPRLRRHGPLSHLDLSAAPLHINQLHAGVPVQGHSGKIPGNGAGIDIERKQHTAVLLLLLKVRGQRHRQAKTPPFRRIMIGCRQKLPGFRKKYSYKRNNITSSLRMHEKFSS